MLRFIYERTLGEIGFAAVLEGRAVVIDHAADGR
jgi:hypothetical protein